MSRVLVSILNWNGARQTLDCVHDLLRHTAGFTYGFLQPEAPIARAHADARVLDPSLDLVHMMEALGRLTDGVAAEGRPADPAAVAFDALGWFGLIEMFIFMATVFVAYAYVWRRGGLDWD